MFDTPKNTLTSENVHNLVVKSLLELPLQAKGKNVSVIDLLNVLLFAATWRTSISEACDSLQNAPHPTTVRRYLSEQLSDLDETEKKLNQILETFIPIGYTKRSQTIAIDLVELPYHGTVDEEYEDEVRRSKAKSGTTHFFAYATAYLIRKGQRYTLAIYRVRQKETMDQVVLRLLSRLEELRINALWFLLDRGFYSVKVFNILEEFRKLYIIPIVKQGKTSNQEGGPTGTRVFAELKASCWRSYTMRNKDKETATFEVAVVCLNFNGKWGRHERETLLYATNCECNKHPDWVRERYRSRFGIESSYRQLNQAKIKTSTRNPVLRLLFVWLALMLRNVWVWLHREVVAERGGGHRKRKPQDLRFGRMLIWLFIEVIRLHPPRLRIDLTLCFHDSFEQIKPRLNY